MGRYVHSIHTKDRLKVVLLIGSTSVVGTSACSCVETVRSMLCKGIQLPPENWKHGRKYSVLYRGRITLL